MSPVNGAAHYYAANGQAEPSNDGQFANGFMHFTNGSVTERVDCMVQLAPCKCTNAVCDADSVCTLRVHEHCLGSRFYDTVLAHCTVLLS